MINDTNWVLKNQRLRLHFGTDEVRKSNNKKSKSLSRDNGNVFSHLNQKFRLFRR